MLRFSASSSERDLRLAILECGQICYARSLMMSNDGNISVRLDETHVLITPAGVSKGRMAAEDLLCIDFDGGLLKTKSAGLPSSETPMHLEAYRQRPDIRAVIHAHPVFATALTVAGMDFPSDVLPEVLLALGEVPVSDYATPSSHDDADAIRALICEHNAVLLRQHGTLTVGVDLEEALIHLERIEHVAEVFWRAHMLGHVEHLPPEARERLLALRDGLSRKKGAS
jgi:L-fuculose-phosphate aldolase